MEGRKSIHLEKFMDKNETFETLGMKNELL